MKKILVLFLMIVTQAWGIITQLDTENADRNITSTITVLTDTPDASNPMLCQGLIYFGDGTKNLDGSGGNFELTITVGGQTIQPSPQVVTFGSEVRSSVWTAPFPVPANAVVILRVKSPNAADSDVDITAYLYVVSTVDVIALSGDTTAADNLEATYDGTGYTDDVAPATQSQLDQIALTGSAVSTPAKDSTAGFTITWGENEANNEDSTHAADDTYHDIEAQNDTGTEKIDVYYEFAIGGDGIPTTVSWEGLLDKGGGSPKDITVQAYNWGGTAWDQVGSITSSNNDISETFTMFTSHVGTGANIGIVRIRFITGSVSFTATTKLRTDQIFVSYAIVVRTVGYSKGAVWINTNASNTNTESFVDGTADNPVSTIAAATTIASNLGLKHFEIVAGSSITLAQAYASYTFAGDNWTLVLNSQVINNTLIMGADVTGICTGTSPHFFDCDFGSATLPGSTLRRCSLGGTITFNDADDYFFDQCYSSIAGTATPDIDFGAAIGSTNLSMRHYSGGIEIKNLGGAGTDKLSLEGNGQLIINSSSDAGTIAIRGAFTITDNAPGGFSGTLSEDARYDTGQINTEVWDKDVSALANTDLAGGILIWLFNLSEGDQFIDITTTPWQAVTNKKGTPGTEYLRKDMFDVSGSNITNIATVIGKQTEP